MKAKELKEQGLVPAWTNFITRGRAGGVTAHAERPVIRLGFFGSNWVSTGLTQLVQPNVDVDEFAGKDWKQCIYAY